MAQHRSTIDVAAAPADAFAYLADLANAPQWDPTIVEAVCSGDAPIGAGAQFALVAAFFGRRIPLTYTIERHEAPTVLELTARGRSVERRDAMVIEPSADGGARITYDTQLRLKGPLRLLDKGLQLQVATMTDRAAAALKANLDALV